MKSRNEKSSIRVLVVDDSAFMRTALTRMILCDSELSVVGTAVNGNDALQKIPDLDPDVITLDMEMPGIDGLETLRRIMSQFPRPVIMVSSATVKGAETTLDALEAGAFDYVPKELSSTSLNILHIREDLIRKIKVAGESRHSMRYLELPRKAPRPVELPTRRGPHPAPAIIAIGISTGNICRFRTHGAGILFFEGVISRD